MSSFTTLGDMIVTNLYKKRHIQGKFNKRITIIPNNIKKFLSFGVGNIKFKDSCQFLMASLDSLTKNLVKKEITENIPRVFKNLSSEFNDEQLQLLKKKVILLYDYLDSFDRFSETSLPDIEIFYNRVYNTDVTQEHYDHAINIWNKFNMKTFGDYV